MKNVKEIRFLAVLTAASLFALTAGCLRGKEKGFIGSAVAEAKTYTVSATSAGILIDVPVDEGDNVNTGQIMAVIDTLPLKFQLVRANASISEIDASISAKRNEISAMELDIAGLKREVKRIGGLVESGSAPSQQLDNLTTKLKSTQKRLAAARRGITALSARRKGAVAGAEQIKLQLERCIIKAPVNGIVLTRFHNKSEVAGTGIPLFEVGRIDSMYVDYFVPQPVVSSLSVGRKVRIRIDKEGAKALFLPAVITLISDKAEFSPKNIQTRESRNELVFRVRAVCANRNNVLKRGLPVEVWR